MKLKIDATYDLFEADGGMVELVEWESHMRRGDRFRLVKTHGEWQRAGTKQRYLGTLYGPGLTAPALYSARRVLMNCEICIYWHDEAYEGAPGLPHVGECRRHAPVALTTVAEPVWPLTKDSDICGDFKDWSDEVDVTETQRPEKVETNGTITTTYGSGNDLRMPATMRRAYGRAYGCVSQQNLQAWAAFMKGLERAAQAKQNKLREEKLKAAMDLIEKRSQ